MTHRQHPPHFPPPLAGFGGKLPPAPDWFAAALADEPERFAVTVQGAPIETLAWGRSGDPGLLLLHGNGAHADWYSFIGPLVKSGRRVAAMSFSGMGGSGWRTQYSVAQWADEALAVAEAAGLFRASQAPTVVAHSFGGFPLMNLAARHGDRLAGAVIVDTPLRPPTMVDARRRHRAENLRSARVYDSLEEAVMRFRLLPPQGCGHPFVADLIARRGLKPVTGPAGRPGWVWRFDPFLFRHFEFGRPYRDLKAARCPITLVRGGRSRLVTAELLAHAQSLAPPGTPVREVPDADHHVMVDQPLAFAALLDELVPKS
ncbi:MAG: alpha/beta hydrolase [Burkholderiaceae bacterium]|nr:alpha/beta hydrolase [Burkholderiaceae bacterium]